MKGIASKTIEVKLIEKRPVKEANFWFWE